MSDPIPTRRGKVFKIRYRVRTAEGKWRHKAETLYGVESKKAARSILLQRIQEASNQLSETAELSLKDFVETYWKPYLQRKNVKPSTEKGYGCVLEVHILPTLGELPLIQISPMHIEELIRGKTRGRSAKTVRNIVAVLQSVLSFAAENDLISKSPVRKKHKPVLTREEKPVWSAGQVRQILAAVPDQSRVLFTTVALTGLRLGELLALQWKHVDFERGRLRIQQSLW